MQLTSFRGRIANASDTVLPTLGCSRDWHGHLRTRTAPLDFEWLALHESITDVELLNPNGAAVPLQKVGTIKLLNNTAYKFEPQQSGVYKLMVSKELLTELALHPADCFCPTVFSAFLDRYNCSIEMGERVRKSMARWRPGSITQEMIDATGIGPGLHTHLEILQLAIIKNKLYCKKENGQNCPPTTEVNKHNRLSPHLRMLHALARKVALPDMLLFWNQGDNPLLDHHGFQPIFSPSSTNSNADLLYPTYTLIKTKFDGGDVALAVEAKPWEARRDVAYFRGTLTGQPQAQAEGIHLINPRLRAAEIALERPDLLDLAVSVHEGHGLDSPVMKALLDRGLVKQGWQPNERGEAKYVVDLPGNSAAWRLGPRFSDGAVTIKSQSVWKEFWHYLLEPEKNVLLVGEWPDDLVDKVEAAKARDADMRCVARAAQLTALTQLRQEEILCWMALSLQHLSTKYRFRPNLTSDWLEIPAKHRDPELCNCTR